MRTKTSRPIVALLAFVVSAVFATATMADEMKLAQTAAEHEAMAKSYKDQAAGYKKVADDHRAMAEAYKKSFSAPPSKAGQKNPWVAKMEKHCAMLAKDADKLTADAEKAADFHTARGKELEGK
jgi:hypothetical protein